VVPYIPMRAKILSISQHGFIKGRSTCTNLLEAINDWTLSVQNKKSVDVAYIDFSRAFDSESYEKLFAHLYIYPGMVFRVTYDCRSSVVLCNAPLWVLCGPLWYFAVFSHTPLCHTGWAKNGATDS